MDFEKVYKLEWDNGEYIFLSFDLLERRGRGWVTLRSELNSVFKRQGIGLGYDYGFHRMYLIERELEYIAALFTPNYRRGRLMSTDEYIPRVISLISLWVKEKEAEAG